MAASCSIQKLDILWFCNLSGFRFCWSWLACLFKRYLFFFGRGWRKMRSTAESGRGLPDRGRNIRSRTWSLLPAMPRGQATILWCRCLHQSLWLRCSTYSQRRCGMLGTMTDVYDCQWSLHFHLRCKKLPYISVNQVLVQYQIAFLNMHARVPFNLFFRYKIFL